MDKSIKETITEDILKDFHQSITERLGRVYNQNAEYRQSIERENKLEDILEKTFSGEQKEVVEEYHNAVCATMSICELLAYRQGMRDMAAILGKEGKKDGTDIE